MKNALLTLLLVACITTPSLVYNTFSHPAYAQGSFNVQAESQFDAYDFDSLSVTTVVGLTAAKISPTNQASAKAVMITVSGNAVHYEYHPGAAPTTTVGHTIPVGSTPVYIRGTNNIRNFRVVADTGTAVVAVTYLH